MSELNTDWETDLRINGVLSHGYGIVPKIVMRDHELSAEAKAIYAFLCSLSGKGNSAYPGRNLILNLLGFSKDRFYKHRKLLIEQGYIEVTETKDDFHSQFSHNIYTLIQNPKKLQLTENEEPGPEAILESQLETEGLERDGYGLIPYAVMADQRLDVKSKAVYAYLASYAGAGRTAFPKVGQITYDLDISENTYRQKMQELRKLGFISVTQLRQTTARKGFASNRYVLCRNVIPEAAQLPAAKKATKKCPEKLSTKNKDTVNQDMEKPSTRNKDTVNQDSNNNNIKPLTKSNNNISNQSDGRMDSEEAEAMIRRQINSEALLKEQSVPEDTLELMISILARPFTTEREITISGKQISGSEVRSQFQKVTDQNVRYVYSTVSSRAGKITNIRGYYQAALFNSVNELPQKNVPQHQASEQSTVSEGNNADNLRKLIARLKEQKDE